MSSPAGKRVLGLLGATFLALAFSSKVAAVPCATPPRVCQTLVIRPSGPLTVYVQALSCIAANGLSWNVNVTDGSRRVRVLTDHAPNLVPGRHIKVPYAGRWRLDVRISNSDPQGQCIRGETVSGFVVVHGLANPGPPARPRQRPNLEATKTPQSTPTPTGTVESAQSSPSPEPFVVGNVALPAPSLAPASEAEEASQPGVGPTGGSPLSLLLLFALGVAGIELVAYAIRRELRSHRRAQRAAVESPAVRLSGNTLRLMKRHRPQP